MEPCVSRPFYPAPTSETLIISLPPPSSPSRFAPLHQQKIQGAEGIIFQFYTDPSLDDLVQGQVRAWAQIISERTPVAFKAGKGGESLGVGYTNFDPDASGSDAARVFGPNYKRLREVKKMYDPENVWNKWYPIEPAE